MTVEQRNIEHSLSYLSVVCEQRTNKQVDYPEFQRSYSENINFLKTVDFPATIRERILSLPDFPKPSILTAHLGGEYFLILGALAPFFVVLLATFTAPVSIPLILWNITTRNRIKSNLQQCSQTLSSVRFLLERPNLEVETSR
jgi:hypothetical protein